MNNYKQECYNRIYEAINDGIKKALIINNSQIDDVSIKWKEKEIKNDVNFQQFFDEAVQKFLNEPFDINNYMEVLSQSNNGTYQYKPLNIAELYGIFQKIKQAYTEKINWSWLDSTSALTFITASGTEMSLSKIKTDKKAEKIEFIKFNNIENFNHPIIIHKNLYCSGKQWIEDVNKEPKFYSGEIYRYNPWEREKSVKFCKRDISGYEHTYNNGNILYYGYNIDNYPALKYCMNKSMKKFKGYMPALGEMSFICDIYDFVNYILTDILNVKPLIYNSPDQADYWITSTESDNPYLMAIRLDRYKSGKFIFSGSQFQKHTYIGQTYYKLPLVLPFFKQI